MADQFFQDKRFGLAIDTLRLAKYAMQQGTARSVGVPSAYNLPTLFQFVTGKLPQTSHRAKADVDATATIFRFPMFWEKRKDSVFQYLECADQDEIDDSDTSVSSAGAGSLSTSSSDDGTEDEDEPLGDRWLEGVNFEPPAGQKPTELFEQSFTSTGRRSGRLHCNSTIMGQNRWWLKLFFTF